MRCAWLGVNHLCETCGALNTLVELRKLSASPIQSTLGGRARFNQNARSACSTDGHSRSSSEVPTRRLFRRMVEPSR